MTDIASAFSSELSAEAAVAELTRGFGDVRPTAVVFFASHHHDGGRISTLLRERYPSAEVIGCTTAGEFTDQMNGVRSVSALALGAGKVKRAGAVLARLDAGAEKGVRRAAEKLEQQLSVTLRDADPKKYVGIVLIDGLHGREEEVNDTLGNLAPLMSFVGGSAGDNLEFKETRVFCNGETSNDGAVLMLFEAAVPFTVAKTCSFRPSGKKFRVTKADVPNRVIYELDGKPVAEVYAKACGVTPDKLDAGVFMRHPVGLMINEKPWIRSPQRMLADGGLKFYCKVLEGMEVHLMEPTALVEETQSAVQSAKQDLGGTLSGGLSFNCILRRLELDAANAHQSFLKSFAGLNTAGFHTYGESWLGHINQTLTALLFA